MIKSTSEALRRAREWPDTIAERAIRAAQDRGITLTHALLALHDCPATPWRDILEALVCNARSTLLGPHHGPGTPDNRAYYLLGVTSEELAFDRARGYAPVAVTSHWIRDMRPSSGDEAILLIWSPRPPHTGVAAHSALVEYHP